MRPRNRPAPCVSNCRMAHQAPCIVFRRRPNGENFVVHFPCRLFNVKKLFFRLVGDCSILRCRLCATAVVACLRLVLGAQIEFHHLELDAVVMRALHVPRQRIADLLVRLDVIGRASGLHFDLFDAAFVAGLGHFALFFRFADFDAWRLAFFQLFQLFWRLALRFWPLGCRFLPAPAVLWPTMASTLRLPTG